MNQVLIRDVKTIVAASAIYGHDVIDIPTGFKYESFGVPPEDSFWLTPGGAACWSKAKQDNPRIILSKLAPSPPPEPVIRTGTFEYTIRPYDIYGDAKIDFAGYDIVGFRPPQKGEQYFSATGSRPTQETAGNSYSSANPRYIVRPIPPPPVIKPFEVRKTYTIDDVYGMSFADLMRLHSSWEYRAFRPPLEGEHYISIVSQGQVPLTCTGNFANEPRLIVTRKA